MSSLIRVLFLSLILLFTNFTYAGTTGKLAGNVKDKSSGEPLIGVNILIDGTMLGATTDLEGNYYILNIPPGRYTVEAQYIGYQTVKTTNLEISVDLTTKHDVVMQEALLELEDEIVVVATRELVVKDLTASTATIDSDEIFALPVTEISEILDLQAGYVDGHVRGGRTGEVAYWVDGVPVTDVYDGSPSVDVSKNTVEEMQFISGAFNAEYGQAMSGIVNITTKEPNRTFGGSVTAFVGDNLSFNNDIFWRAILDMNKVLIYTDETGVLQPTQQRNYLNVVDGIQAMEISQHHVWGGGITYNRHVVLAGVDPVAVDAVGCRIMGYDYSIIPSIGNADSDTVHPIGINDPENIVVIGDDIDSAISYVFGFNPTWSGDAGALAITDFDPPVINTITRYNDNISAEIINGLAAYILYQTESSEYIEKMTKDGDSYSGAIPITTTEYRILAQDEYFNTVQMDLEEYTLTVNILGNGIVNRDDPGPYNYGDIVQLTAVPDSGWSFTGWSDDLSGSTNPDSITMDGNKTVTATFTIEVGILGDVNGDDTVNSTDALIILSCDVGLDTSAYCPMNRGDVNDDGLINSTDALIILSYDVGISVPYPVGEPGYPSDVTPCPGCS